MKTDRVVQLVQLYNRSGRLLNSLHGRKTVRRSWDMANQYNTIREDVKRFVNDPRFDRTIPSAWCFKLFPDIPLAVLIIALAMGSVYLLWGEKVFGAVLAISALAAFCGILGTLAWLSSNDWALASTIEQVRDRTATLYGYLQDYIDLNPDYASRIKPKGAQKLEHQLEELQSQNFELEEELESTRHECQRLKERLGGLETPSQFEVPEQVLNKLDQLERRRLEEVVQAYRVNAWTPAAAVCGMLLEGQLQRLCRENDLQPGGIGDMIRRLGEAGLLRGYYQNLAQVGEFFRHRASHPTSEEFDREKTTLALTSLIILIRDLL
jgi:hypothetical protein